MTALVLASVGALLGLLWAVRTLRREESPEEAEQRPDPGLVWVLDPQEAWKGSGVEAEAELPGRPGAPMAFKEAVEEIYARAFCAPGTFYCHSCEQWEEPSILDPQFCAGCARMQRDRVARGAR